MLNRQRLLRACAVSLLVAPLGLAQTAESNVLPEGDFENPAFALPEFWCRMGEYATSAHDVWENDTDAAHSGKASARGSSAAEYVMQAEMSPAGKWLLQGLLKAERDNATCRVRLSWYSNWHLMSESKTVQVGTDWTPFSLEADLHGGKIGTRGTVAEVGVHPESEGKFWLDDVTLCPVKGTANMPRPRASSVPSATPLPAPPPPAAGNGKSGEVELRLLDVPALPVPFHVSVGVPLPPGEIYDPGCVRVVATDGDVLPAQARVLSRWLADASVQSLLLSFALPPETKQAPTVAYQGHEPAQATTVEAPIGRPTSPEGCNELVPFALDASPNLTGALGGGSNVRSSRPPTQLLSGPVVCSWYRGFSFGEVQHHGQFQLWVDGYCGAARVDVEAVFVNDVPGFVQDIESLWLELPLQVDPNRPSVIGLVDAEPIRDRSIGGVLQVERNGIFSYRVSRRDGDVEKDGRLAGWFVFPAPDGFWGLAVKDFWWKHPRAVTTGNGIGPVRLHLWPKDVRDLRLSRGASISARFSLVKGERESDVIALCRTLAADPEPLIAAEPAAYCRSGAFGVTLTPGASSLPVFENTLGGMYPLTHWTASRHSRQGKLKAGNHGVFDYGDGPGDGGWGNAETMLGHAFYQWFFYTGERETLDVAQALARHFRDMDVEHPYGEIHSHCINHTLSGAGPSHSWVQGMCDDYLLTGNLRTLEVLRSCGRWLCSLPVEKYTGRDFTRILDNLVDLYLFTGDAEFRDRALDYARELGKRQDPSRVLSGGAARSWFEHRYTAGTAFVWYGTYALAKLHHAMPTNELRRIFLTELDISLNSSDRIPFIYERYPDRRGLYPENPGAAFQAQEIGQWAKGRGAVLWPSLAYAFGLTGNREYLEVGFRSLGYYSRSMTPDTALFATPFLNVLKENGYGAGQESALLEQIAGELASRYPPALVDPGLDTEGLNGWTLTNRKQRIESVRDTEVRFAGASSLRMTSHVPHSKSYCATKFYCPTPGRYRVRVKCKLGQGVRGGLAVNYSRFLPPEGASHYGGWPEGDTDGAEWRNIETEFDVPGPGTLQVLVYNIKSIGSVWYDDVRVERVGDVRVPPAGQLQNPGFEDGTLTGWSRSAPWTCRAGPDAGRAVEGRQSLRIDGVGKRDGRVSQQLPLEPGRSYRLSVCVSADAPAVAAVKVEAPGRTEEAKLAEDQRGAPKGWSLQSATIQAPQNGLVTIELHNTAGEGTVWFDDVRLE